MNENRNLVQQVDVLGFDLAFKDFLENETNLKHYFYFNENDIEITDECLKYIIKTYTIEKGLRSLNRCLETIFNKLNVLKLLGENINKYNFSFNLKINFPYKLNIKDIDILLKDRIITENKNVYSMYM
jgi:ATP-dependent Lon protease